MHPALAAHRRLAGRCDDRLLTELECVVVDTELTGFDPDRDALVSIGAVRIRDMAIVPGEVFYTLVRPVAGVPRAASLIHRLTDAELAAAPSTDEALAAFAVYCGPAVCVGHHVDLDMAFLNAAARRHLGGELAAPCIDTLRLAMAYEEKRLGMSGGDGAFEHMEYSLHAVCNRYGLPVFAAHDARNDALQTAYLFLYLVRKLARGRPLTLAGLWRACHPWWRW
jgi:DNA polymerase-3 subunit epsilon